MTIRDECYHNQSANFVVFVAFARLERLLTMLKLSAIPTRRNPRY